MSAEEPGPDVPHERGRPIQWAALIVTILFLAAGVLLFVLFFVVLDLVVPARNVLLDRRIDG